MFFVLHIFHFAGFGFGLVTGISHFIEFLQKGIRIGGEFTPALLTAEINATPLVIGENRLVFELLAGHRAIGLDVLEQHALFVGFLEVLVGIGFQLG